MTDGRSKTFPATSRTCNVDHSQSPPEPVPTSSFVRSPHPSDIVRKGVESWVQTEDLEPTEERMLKDIRSSPVKKPAFSSTARPGGDQSRTLPFAAPSVKQVPPSSKPTPVTKVSNKTADDAWRKKSEMSMDSGELLLVDNQASPSRRAPSLPPLCTQCAALLRQAPSETQPEPETNAHSSPMGNHSCGRLSMQCQQCFPSGQTSSSISSKRIPSPAQVQHETPQISRRPTKAATPVSPNTDLEKLQSRHPVEQVLNEDVKACWSPEEKLDQSKIVDVLNDEFMRQAPTADPMKRPSPPKLRSRPSPTARGHPNQAPYVSTASRARTPYSVRQPPRIICAAPVVGLASASTSLDSSPSYPEQVTDKQVFRGLHVATAAACDEDVDKWIQEITGTSTRNFLATLSAFDGLGMNALAGVAKRAARQRREQVRAWEAVRELKAARSELDDDQPLGVARDFVKP